MRFITDKKIVFPAFIVLMMLGCSSDPASNEIYWQDIHTRELRSFFEKQDIAVRHIGIGNAGGIHLDLRGSNFTDLSMLFGMPLEVLLLANTSIQDLSYLRDMRFLRKLDLSSTKVKDLTPLAALSIEELNISNTEVVDLEPIRKLPIRMLSFVNTDVRDLSPLESMPIETVFFSTNKIVGKVNLRILQEKASIRCINLYGDVRQFWAENYGINYSTVSPPPTATTTPTAP